MSTYVYSENDHQETTAHPLIASATDGVCFLQT